MMTDHVSQPYGRPVLPGPLLTDYLRHWAHFTPAEPSFSFVQYASDHLGGQRRLLTWSRLHRHVRAVAAAIEESIGGSGPVAILAPQGLQYVVGFLACLYTGAIAVPLFPPDLHSHGDRLAAILDDCRPKLVLTTQEYQPQVADLLARRGGTVPQLGVIEQAPEAGADWSPPRPDPGDLAYLQYTSSSTRAPAGVMVSHRNVVANANQAMAAYAVSDGPSHSVGWLPLFQDLGLVLSLAAPVVAGIPSVLMDPVSFLVQPVRWLHLLAERPGGISAAPNFAYDHCTDGVGPEVRRSLRLDQVKALINSSELVRPRTVDRFTAAFAECGLRPEAVCPSYGLAEVSVLVAAADPRRPHHTVSVDRAALTQNRLLVSERPDAQRLVSCGLPVNQRVLITDPLLGTECAPGTVGEIRVQGPNVTYGYWGQGKLSRATPDVETPTVNSAPGASADPAPWLSTGDLGCLHGGELVVTGRLKDLIVIDGRNYYPQDLEEAVHGAHPGMRHDRVAAFTVDDQRGPSLAVLAERERTVPPADPLTIENAVRTALWARFGLFLAGFRIVPSGRIPRTSSGKMSRRACRELYLLGRFGESAQPQSHI